MADAASCTFLLQSLTEWAQNRKKLVRGLEKEIGSLAQGLNRVRDLLYAAQRRGYKGESAEEWLLQLERASYEMEEVLDECYALRRLGKDDRDHESEEEDAAAAAAAVAAAPKKKVRSLIPSFSCMSCKKNSLHYGIANRVADVRRTLDGILEQKDRLEFAVLRESSRDPWTPLAESVLVHGRESDRDILVTKLTGREEELGVQVVSIVGIGGIGKTTLAQLVFNDSRVCETFSLRIWICVSDPFDLVSIAKEILESVGGGSSSNATQLNVLLREVKESIFGKRFLLVLDDVWTEDSWKWRSLKSYLECGETGSKVLVTTRNPNIAKIMDTVDDDIHHLGKLTDEECWRLLCSEAFPGRDQEKIEAEFKDIGERIAKEKCGGLPLVAKVLGSLLGSISSLNDWRKILNLELWELREGEELIFPCLLLSYDKFTTMQKRCFSYCAVLPKDTEICVEDLIGKWMALGYLGPNTSDMELKGRECFDFLAMHSLFQDLEEDGLGTGEIKSCKMPDIVHDFAQYLRRRRVDGQESDPLLYSNVTEFYSILSSNFVFGDVPEHLQNGVKRLRVLSMPNRIQSFPQAVKYLIHLRWLKLDGNHLSVEDLEVIFQLYSLQTLLLRNCKLEEIPGEIGNLIHLRHLDLRDNRDLKELPESIGSLKELRTLKVENCPRLIRLPKEMDGLINLRHLLSDFTFGVNGLCNLGLFQKMNLLSGTLRLKILVADDYLVEDVVESTREAKLREKRDIERLVVEFEDEIGRVGGASIGEMRLLDALVPHPELESLEIRSYNGPRLPAWIVLGDLSYLMKIRIISCDYISSLVPLAKLAWLEEIEMFSMRRLQLVDRESASTTTVAFPKLKKLTFYECHNWREWEDITAEEEESAHVQLMPCLTTLNLQYCHELTELPHRLLRKVSSLKVLDLSYSEKLQRRYAGSSVGISLFQNPRLQITWRS